MSLYYRKSNTEARDFSRVRLHIKYRNTDSEFISKQRMLSYIPDKNGEPKTMPFWYRGRVYEIIEQGENK